MTHKYTTSSGSQTLNFGDKVRVANGYSGLGLDGQVYQYMGGTGSVNLGAADFTNPTLWKILKPLDVLPSGIVNSALTAAGIEGGTADAISELITRNDVRSDVLAKIDTVTLNAGSGAVSVSATEQNGNYRAR